jgi:hypothetical protein
MEQRGDAKAHGAAVSQLSLRQPVQLRVERGEKRFRRGSISALGCRN